VNLTYLRIDLVRQVRDVSSPYVGTAVTVPERKYADQLAAPRASLHPGTALHGCNSNVRQSRKHAGSGRARASTPRRLPGVILPADSDPQDGTRT